MKAIVPGVLVISSLLTTPAGAGITLNDCGGFREFTRTPGLSTWPDTNTLIYEAFYYTGDPIFTRLHGKPPAARWWSFAIVDMKRAEFATISDQEVVLNEDGSYDVDIKPTCLGAPNCVEVGNNPVGRLAGRIFYRLYVPDGDETGGVGLPTVEYRSANEVGEAGPFGDDDSCRKLIADLHEPFSSGAVSEGADDDEGAAFVLLASPTGLENDVCSPGAPPAVNRYRGTGGQQIDQIEDMGVLPPEAIDAIRFLVGGTGSGATRDNAYVTSIYNLRNGNLVLRAKAPTYRKQHDRAKNDLGVDDGTEQVRYWSVCTTQASRPVDCVRDENVAVDPDGFFRIIISPVCPIAGYDNCLRGGITSAAGLGGAPFLIYRNTLPRQDFFNDRGPNVCHPGEENTVFCGDYAPVATYVQRNCLQ